jgi:hypothetical protein
VGVEHNQPAGSDTVFYDDITVSEGDLIQGYGNNQSINYSFYLQRFRLAYDEAITHINSRALLVPINTTTMTAITVTNIA